MRRILLYIVVFIWCVLLSGCAATSTTVMDEEVVTNQKPMSTYKSLIIKDFELKRELYSNLPDSKTGEQELRYAKMPEHLSAQILRYARSRHIYQSVERDGSASATTIVLKGRFTRVGRFRISLEATLLDGATGQEVAYCRQTLWDVLDTTESIGRLGREIADFIDRIQYK